MLALIALAVVANAPALANDCPEYPVDMKNLVIADFRTNCWFKMPP